jgi:hypothetical protein
MTFREEQDEAAERRHEYTLRLGMAGLGPNDAVPQALHNFAVAAAHDHIVAIREQQRLDRIERLRGIANNL